MHSTHTCRQRGKERERERERERTKEKKCVGVDNAGLIERNMFANRVKVSFITHASELSDDEPDCKQNLHMNGANSAS